MSETLYRLRVVYRRTRPYHPEALKESNNPYNRHQAWYQRDVAEVGQKMEKVIGPYKTKGAVGAQYKRVKQEYPLANIYRDQSIGYYIISENWERAEPVIEWKEFTP